MSRRVNIEEFESFTYITFYTIRYDDIDDSLTDTFFLQYKDDERYAEYVFELSNIIENIGNHGDIDGGKIFRSENKARALPPKREAKTGYLHLRSEPPLRLFCYCVSDEIIILFGGGVKSAMPVQDCPTLRMPFQEAQKLSQAIADAIKDGSITHTGKILYPPPGSMEKDIFFFI